MTRINAKVTKAFSMGANDFAALPVGWRNMATRGEGYRDTVDYYRSQWDMLRWPRNLRNSALKMGLRHSNRSNFKKRR